MVLSETVRVQVRFSEVDSIKMVWHGNYITYMEDAREAFGRKYGLEYMYIYDHARAYCRVFLSLFRTT